MKRVVFLGFCRCIDLVHELWQQIAAPLLASLGITRNTGFVGGLSYQFTGILVGGNGGRQ